MVLNLSIIAEKNQTITELYSALAENGFVCSIIPYENEVMEQIAEYTPDLVLVEMNGRSTTHELPHRIRRERNLPIIALVDRESLNGVDGHSDIDDFLVKPYEVRELVLRIRRLLHKTNNSDNGELIRCGDLVIDVAKCEVSVDGRLLMLTFREYELLRFLASNKGRVFTREALLNKVWGYDYFGGDRTVDVHIRRLRSKIEDSNHTFIETVRNIGYRFKSNS